MQIPWAESFLNIDLMRRPSLGKKAQNGKNFRQSTASGAHFLIMTRVVTMSVEAKEQIQDELGRLRRQLERARSDAGLKIVRCHSSYGREVQGRAIYGKVEQSLLELQSL
jgi:hypothetical protein